MEDSARPRRACLRSDNGISRRFRAWRRAAGEGPPARQAGPHKLLDLLHYAPPACNPAAETVELVDYGGYVREKVWFNTTPEVRVPACVLVPKNAPKRALAIVALHDPGGFYL